MAGRKTTSLDLRIGERIREHRLRRTISREQLGAALGVSFQQIQKYEVGANRISAARLADVAAVLNVPITTFYEGLAPSRRANPAAAFDVSGLTAESLQLARAFQAIRNGTKRRQILAFVQSVSGKPRQSVA